MRPPAALVENPSVFNRAPSPVVVKEMRQGLKSRGFVLGLAGLQLLMVFSMLMYLDADSRREFNNAHGFFWFCLALPLLAVIPLRGFNSVQEERKNKTLELVFLTRLTAWKIVLGKWQALFYQSLLTFVSALPYLVLRYFLGSVDLVADLTLLLFMLLGSALLIALGVLLSAVSSRIVRGLALLAGINLFTTMPMAYMGMRAFGGSPGGSLWSMGDYVFIIGMGLLVLVFLLEYAASLIAPPAENHSRWKRLLALITLAYAAPWVFFFGDSEWLAFPMIILGVAIVDSLCEQPRYLPIIFRKNRWPVVNGLFLPGWPAGVAFTLVAIGVFSLAMIFGGGLSSSDTEEFLFALPAFVGGLLFPLIITTRIKRPMTSLFGPYFIVQLALGIFTIIILIISEVLNWRELYIFGVLPGPSIFLMLADKGYESVYATINTVSAIGILLLILPAMITSWKRTKAMLASTAPVS